MSINQTSRGTDQGEVNEIYLNIIKQISLSDSYAVWLIYKNCVTSTEKDNTRNIYSL